MATDDDIQRYIACMQEIKKRVEVVKPFFDKAVTTGHPITDAEFICLQLRKILELIALSSLCAHREQYEEVRKSFRTDWKAEKIFGEIEKLNPNFYPLPYIQKSINPETGRVNALDEKKEGFLTRVEFKTAYDRCSAFLHAYNLYSFKPADLDELRETCREWIVKIIELLNTHIIQLIDDRKRLYVQMRVKPHGDVVVEERERVD